MRRTGEREGDRVRLKICGINDPGIAAEAEAGGADYLGFIFAVRSPRAVTAARAREIMAATSGRARRVGVFAGQGVAEVGAVAGELGLDVVQLHGAYGDGEVRRLQAAGFEVWRLDGGTGAGDGAGPEDAVLLDGKSGTTTGGTGKRADWERARGLKRAGKRVVLAGGLSAANLAEAAETGCDVLDVNSSLEVAPGVKSAERVAELLRVWRGLAASKSEP